MDPRTYYIPRTTDAAISSFWQDALEFSLISIYWALPAATLTTSLLHTLFFIPRSAMPSHCDPHLYPLSIPLRRQALNPKILVKLLQRKGWAESVAFVSTDVLIRYCYFFTEEYLKIDLARESLNWCYNSFIISPGLSLFLKNRKSSSAMTVTNVCSSHDKMSFSIETAFTLLI